MIFASFHQGKEENMFCLLYVFQVLQQAQGKQRSGASAGSLHFPSSYFKFFCWGG
jgi:hypothetical protein